ncbi:MAG: YggS family pyridoxal phosphate-dependent enzyme [Lentisphaeria bacterium]|nr:YggS family pyridoxal phosphate-dependent enzyme [Lentisphaeria bacterium]
MSLVVENFLAVKAEVEAAAAAAGRDPGEVKLLVVSKTIPLPVIEELYACGVREFGENRISELAGKAAAMPGDVVWHFIGPVQSNKVRKIVQCADVIHSVDTVEKLERFDRIAGEEGKHPEILLEVNVSGEASKGGVAPAELPVLAAAAAGCAHLRCRGLMTMAPPAAEHDELMRIFSALRRLRDEVAAAGSRDWPVLSMGMSRDFPEAIDCGATIVRIGSRIFAGVPR